MPKINLRNVLTALVHLAAAAPVIIAAARPAVDALKKDKPAG